MNSKAGLMWSTHYRTDRKTHAFVDPNILPLCNPGMCDIFVWDYDVPTETAEELARRVEKTDADGIVCRSCLRSLRARI